MKSETLFARPASENPYPFSGGDRPVIRGGFMRQITMGLILAGGFGVTSFTALTQADEPKEKSKDRIVSVVVLKPGETKDVHLSSSCARITRGRGLLLRAMGEGYLDAKKEWAGDGISAAFAEVNEADEPVPLKEANFKLFTVRISATKDAKAQLKELHVADETCSGTCDTDIRVVVVAP